MNLEELIDEDFLIECLEDFKVLRKALELACERLGAIEECNHCIAYGCDGDDTCSNSIAIRLLQKARKEE